MISLYFILASLFLTLVTAQSIDSCTDQNTCNECIQTRGCAWCLKLISGLDDSPRCHSMVSIDQICVKSFIENPRNASIVSENRKLTQGRAKPGEKIVQIYPQRMNLKLRINQPQKIYLTYSRAEDYPVDLYYLMDLSYSMNDDKAKLSTLGKSIADVMTSITKDFRLGFGSFVDKSTQPYVSTVPLDLIKPCYKCESGPYGFKNHMRLNIDANRFETEVRNAPISGNVDTPEGGFDALMQVMVCHEEIGWREQAHRLVVFSTDAEYHYAGDGKLGGIVKPNDGKCHMLNHSYTHSLIQDYPSVAHINAQVQENAMNVIFAVTEDVEKVYKKLSEHIEGSYASTLQHDSANIARLIKEQYSKISSTIEMKDNATENLNLNYFSRCLGGPLRNTKKCDAIKVGNQVQFEITITASSCLTDNHQTLKIYPIGIDEALILDIDIICSCECERSTHETYQTNSILCKNQGTHKCGICHCNEGYSGRQCECSHDSNNDQIDGNCAKIDCNDRGNCVCGTCDCFKRQNPTEEIFGKFCECDNFSCERQNGLLCSGRGKCKCRGECDCMAGWGGSACTCRTTNDTCRASVDDTSLCSGHGECVCGECQCEKTEDNRRFGRFCEKCPTCAAKCRDFKDCLQCEVYGTGPLSKKQGLCKENCTNIFSLVKVETLGEIQSEEEQFCTVYDENLCRFDFIYNDRDEKQIIVRTDQTLICSPKVLPFNVIISIVGSIVLIGLGTLLLWKFITMIQYRREFSRFEEERQKACWNTGQNPLYREATSTFLNPTYMETKSD